MIKLIDLLNEAPIGTYKTIGDFEKGASYKDTRDRAIFILLTSLV